MDLLHTDIFYQYHFDDLLGLILHLFLLILNPHLLILCKDDVGIYGQSLLLLLFNLFLLT